MRAEYTKAITNEVDKSYVKKLGKEEADKSNASPG
jgi:hypothetical protein